LSKRFLDAFADLPAEIQQKADKTLELLRQDPRYPSLQTKPVQGREGIYEARVDIHYRLTYNRLHGDFLVIRTVGRHDHVLRNP